MSMNPFCENAMEEAVKLKVRFNNTTTQQSALVPKAAIPLVLGGYSGGMCLRCRDLVANHIVLCTSIFSRRSFSATWPLNTTRHFSFSFHSQEIVRHAYQRYHDR